MAWLSPLPFVVPALAILMLLVLSEEPARFLYDTFSPLCVPSFFVLGGLNIALFTLRYFRRRDCLYVFLFSLLVAVSFVALPLMHKLNQDGSHHQRILNIVYYLVVSNGLFGYLGLMRNERLGLYRLYATSRSDYVLIESERRKYVVSCPEREEFIAACQHYLDAYRRQAQIQNY